MTKTTRREFLKRSGVGVAGLSLLPSKLMASPGSSAATNDSLPPHKSMVVPGIHGYAEQSVAAGETIHFQISSTVPHRLGIYRLARASFDENLTRYKERIDTSPLLPLPIRGGEETLFSWWIGSARGTMISCWSASSVSPARSPAGLQLHGAAG